MILGLPDEANLLSHAYMIDGDVDTDVECLQEYFLRLFGIEDIYQSVDVTVFDGSEVGVDEVRELQRIQCFFFLRIILTSCCPRYCPER